MKKQLYFLSIIGILVFIPQVSGQKNVVVVEPDEGVNIGALNDAIADVDSTERGNTIFELRRDGLYLINGGISHSGYTLHIRGEDGPGSKPVLQSAVDELGEGARLFTPSGGLILENLYLLGRDENGGIENQPIRITADSLEIIVDNCVLDYSNQSMVRTNSSGNVVYVINSVLRNSLRPDNPSNGRIIDTRGNPNDTLWIANNTIYNNGATQLRSDGGFTLFANFDHNTVYQTSFNHNMALDIIFKANVTNNLFYNFLYRGGKSNHDAFFRVDSMFTIGDKSDADRYFDFSNNNWYTEDTIGYIIDTYGPDTIDGQYSFDEINDPDHLDTLYFPEILRTSWFANDSLLALDLPEGPPTIMHFIENGQVDTTGLFREKLVFRNPPPLNLDYWKFYTENGWAISGTNPPNAFADEDPLVLGEVQEGAFDFSYNASSRSATAADDGLPLGASKWVPFTPVSARDLKMRTGVSTFPNPFENMVTFNIESQQASDVRIQVFDLLGKEICAVYDAVGQGNEQVTVNLNKITHPGIYLYKIEFITDEGIRTSSSGKLIKK